ncbi:MAG: hypothetical protein K2P67_05075 [Gallionellaceae bacterium]|jgi:hypothetical protein|nr:hypothetical protein [Gallionellaceae bacterium]
MQLSQFRAKFLLTTLLQFLIHANDAAARGGYTGTCRGPENECGGSAIIGFSFIAFVAIYFKVLGKRPAKDCPGFFLILIFMGISIALAFVTVIIASSVVGLSLLWAWLLGGISCFTSFAYLLNLSFTK